MSSVEKISMLTQMQRFLDQINVDVTRDREKLFLETFQLQKDELDTRLFFGMFDLHSDADFLQRQLNRISLCDYESYIQNELTSLQATYPSGKPIQFELLILDQHDEFVKKKLGGVSAFTEWDGHMCFIVEADEGVRDTLKSVIFHEYHHHWRMSKLNMTEGNETLLDRLVLEGLAEHFVRIELGDAFLGPYKSVLSEKEAQQLWDTTFRHHIHDRGNITGSYMFGDKEMQLPFWGGYSLGYHLIEWYMNDNSEWTIEGLTELPSKTFIVER